MNDDPKPVPDPDRPVHIVDPADVLSGGNPRGEVLGCPTGLSGEGPAEPAVDSEEVHGPLEVEKLEGRQEAARED